MSGLSIPVPGSREETECNALVPARQEAARRERLADRNPLLLTAGNSSDGRVAHQCVLDVPEAKHGLEDVRHNIHMASPCRRIELAVGRAGDRRELEGLLDGQSGEVEVVLGAVLDVTAAVLLDVPVRHRVVVHVTLDRVVVAPLIRERPQQRRAPRPWSSQDNCVASSGHVRFQARVMPRELTKHLAGAHDAFEPAEDVPRCRMAHVLDALNPVGGVEGRAEGGLNRGGFAEPYYPQVLKQDTKLPALDVRAVHPAVRG